MSFNCEGSFDNLVKAKRLKPLKKALYCMKLSMQT